MGIPGEPPLLTGQADRDRLLLLAGMHGVLDLEFTREFAMHSPEDFVRIFMVEGLGVRTVVLGEDALFGRANAGTIDTMRELGRRSDFEVITVADLGPEPAGLVPADGVYAGHLTVVEQHPDHADVPPLTGAPATISIGTNPTFTIAGRPRRTVEAYVHDDHDLELYGDTVRLEFVDFQ